MRLALEQQLGEQIGPVMEELVQRALDMAMQGDTKMMVFFLERYLPKATSIEVEDGSVNKITFNIRNLDLGERVDIIDVTPEKTTKEESLQ